jgi:hypothetical protein
MEILEGRICGRERATGGRPLLTRQLRVTRRAPGDRQNREAKQSGKRNRLWSEPEPVP